uniref:Uncharacterized protein n=1 Tax=Mola mola TaxID=94237 RepID=A0A3Q3WZB5_MOLML
MDSAYLLETVTGNFVDVVQYNEDNRAFEGVVGTNITIKVLCDVMTDSSLGEPYARYAAVACLMMDTFSMKCLDASFTTYLRDKTNTTWDGPVATTEFGLCQSANSPNQQFAGFPLQYQVKQCANFYNVSAEVLAEANIRSSRIVFPNGSVDPWHASGITQNITPDLKAIFIKGTAHYLPQLSLARDHVLFILQQWRPRSYRPAPHVHSGILFDGSTD